MRQLIAWGLTASLLVGWGTLVARGADDDATDLPPKKVHYGQRGLLDDVFGGPAKPAAKKPSSRLAKTASQHGDKAEIKDETPLADAATPRSQEETNWLRRMDACDVLKRIAMESNDTELLHRAEQLNERAWKIYVQRTGAKTASTTALDTEEKMLEQKLQAEAPPAGRKAADSSRELKNRSALLEGKP
jgi:hypothetical protein